MPPPPSFADWQRAFRDELERSPVDPAVETHLLLEDELGEERAAA